MTATAHAIVGGAIATKVSSLEVAIPLALVSHFLGDKLPHWDAMVNHLHKSKILIVVESGFDAVFGLFLAYLIFVVFMHQGFWPVMVTAFAAQAPDWMEIPYIFFRKRFFPFDLVYRFQRWIHDVGFNSRTQAPWGVITQVVVVICFLFWSFS